MLAISWPCGPSVQSDLHCAESIPRGPRAAEADCDMWRRCSANCSGLDPANCLTDAAAVLIRTHDTGTIQYERDITAALRLPIFRQILKLPAFLRRSDSSRRAIALENLLLGEANRRRKRLPDGPCCCFETAADHQSNYTPQACAKHGSFSVLSGSKPIKLRESTRLHELKIDQGRTPAVLLVTLAIADV